MKIIRDQFNNKIVKNSVILVSGTAIANFLLMGFQLILRRMYTPEDFAALGLYLSITGILIVISTLRYEFAVVLPKKERDANSIVAGGLIVSIIINILFFIIILFFKNTIVDLVNFPSQYSYWLYFAPLSVLSYSIYQFFNYWLTRKSKFMALSGNKVVRRFSEGCIQTSLKLCNSSSGLVIGEVVGNVLNAIAGWIQSKNAGFTFKTISLKKIKLSLKRYSDFPKYQVFPMLLNTISVLIPIFFISKFYGADSTGQFDLTRQVLVIPLGFVTAALSQVLLKEYSDKVKNKQAILAGINKTVLVLALIILPFLITILFFGDILFAFLFSDIWAKAGEFSSILVVAYSIQFVISPLWTVFTVLGKLKALAVWQTISFLAIGSLFFFSYLSIESFLLLYTAITVALYIACYIMILVYSRKYESLIRKEL